MPLTAAAKNAMLDELGTLITHIGLADASAEVAGGTYARQAVTWSAAAAGVLAMSGTEVFNVPAGEGLDRVILRSALSGGTDYGYASVTAETFGGAGTYTVNTLTITLADA